MDDLEQRLRGLFLEDLQDGLRALYDGVAELQRHDDGAQLPGVQAELFRVAHSLKGAGHSANVPAAIDICHRLEDTFARLQSGSRSIDAALLEEVTAALDALSTVEEGLRDGRAAMSPAAPSTVPRDARPPTASPPQPQEPRLRVAVRAADELVTQVTQLVDELSRAGVTDPAVTQAASRVVETTHVLRLQSFAEACAGLDVAATEVATTSGKRVRLVVEGGETRLDRAVAAALREPLLHLVRNAVDHGIESPEARRAAGKPTEGTVRVRAVVVEGTIDVSVTDDGAGVDRQALRAAAERGGVAVGDNDDTEFAFSPGVSTAQELTVVSGRGIGLDAVRDRIERLGGAVRLSSSAGEGTSVVCTVPSTLATVHVLLVTAGGERVALPVGALARVQDIDPSSLHDVGGRRVVLGAEPAAVVGLSSALGVDGSTAADDDRLVAVRLTPAAGGGALQVDTVDGDLVGVLRPLPTRVLGLSGVLGLLNLPGGGLVPVLNAASCMRWGVERSRPQAGPPAAQERRHRVLLVEDTLTTRVLEQSILETAGYDVVAAADGAQAWSVLQLERVDIVVSDVDMPNMNGMELCRAIRGDARFADLPVVLVTSLGSDDDRRRGAEAGANAYLVKSAFDRQLLLEAVGRLL